MLHFPATNGMQQATKHFMGYGGNRGVAYNLECRVIYMVPSYNVLSLCRVMLTHLYAVMSDVYDSP